MSSTPTNIVGIFLVIGGAIGFVKAHSKVSLLMGLLSGSVLFYSASQIPHPFGYELSIGYSLFLGMLMGYRFIVKSAKFMPTGLVATLSLSLALYNFIVYKL